MLSLLLSMMPAAAFAADVPVLLTASEAGVDVTVSENITLTSQAGSADLIVSDLTVKNNASIGSVEVTGISANAENGWSLVPAEAGFEAMQANAKKIYIGYGNHDFSSGPITSTILEITPGQTETINLAAKTGIVTSNISEQRVATVVLTIGIKQGIISFKIDGASYQAEAGSTWSNWINSPYGDKTPFSVEYGKEDDYIIYSYENYNLAVVYDKANYVYVQPSDKIINGYAYEIYEIV